MVDRNDFCGCLLPFVDTVPSLNQILSALESSLYLTLLSSSTIASLIKPEMSQLKSIGELYVRSVRILVKSSSLSRDQ